MEYSRLLAWEVTNFLSVEHGLCEFDESGIIMLKGYNDSGKSTMLRALDVLFFNSNPRDQVALIQDDKDYFRIVAKFSDDVYILRDKYLNGQSLYEMYKGGQCIFSTKVNGVLTKVSEVPEPIRVYLGLVPELTVRTVYDKQFIVDTSGSENYKSLSSILRTEEIAKASELINTDKNKLQNDIGIVESQLDAYKAVVKDGSLFTEDLILYLEKVDKSIDAHDITLDNLSSLDASIQSVGGIKIYPEVPIVDIQDLNDIDRVLRTTAEIDGIRLVPELKPIDIDSLTELRKIMGVCSELGSVEIPPTVPTVDCEELLDLAKICGIQVPSESDQPVVPTMDCDQVRELENILSISRSLPDISAYDEQLSEIEDEIKSLVSQFGEDVIVCPDCGHVITSNEIHSH